MRSVRGWLVVFMVLSWNEALAGPSQAEGVTGLGTVAARMKPLCDSCCRPSETEERCTPDQCKAEADAIQAALLASWNANYGKGSNTSRDEVGGYLCWDWSKFFEDAVRGTSPRCWSVNNGMATTTASRAVHYWIDLDACPGDPACRVSVDDGWFDRGFVHAPPWPVGGTWSRGTLPRPPSGRTHTPPKPARPSGPTEHGAMAIVAAVLGLLLLMRICANRARRAS